MKVLRLRFTSTGSDVTHRVFLRVTIAAVILWAFSGAGTLAQAEGTASNQAPDKSERGANHPALPPVLPGESVTTDDGDKIKVWSTSGGVVVGAVPTAPVVGSPQRPGLGGDLGGVGINGIIVDARP